jgi:membrane-associated phospholipid phosphatase
VLRAWLRRSIRRHLGAIWRRASSLLDHPRLTDARRYLTPLLQLPDDWRSPYARFWLELVGGALALLAAAWLFGILAEDVVTGDRLTLVDEVLVKWLYAHATPAVTRAMLVVTGLGGSVVVASLTLVTAALLMSMRRWPWVLTLILVVPGGALLNELLKVAFQRARPKFDIPILVLKDYGFPSGHTSR